MMWNVIFCFKGILNLAEKLAFLVPLRSFSQMYRMYTFNNAILYKGNLYTFFFALFLLRHLLQSWAALQPLTQWTSVVTLHTLSQQDGKIQPRRSVVNFKPQWRDTDIYISRVFTSASYYKKLIPVHHNNSSPLLSMFKHSYYVMYQCILPSTL